MKGRIGGVSKGIVGALIYSATGHQSVHDATLLIGEGRVSSVWRLK